MSEGKIILLERSKLKIKELIEKSDWWKYIQDDAKKQIVYYVENIDIFGFFFKRTFRSLSNLEHTRRKQRKSNLNIKEAGILFGTLLPEEVYQSSKNATKIVLELNEWTEPNEADVQACRVLCEQIDFLEAANLLEISTSIYPSEKPVSA